MRKKNTNNVENISFQYELQNAFKYKSKRQVFIDGYNRALNDRFNWNSKIIIYSLFFIGITTIIYGFFKILK